MKNNELEDIIFDQGSHMVEFLRSHPFISVTAVEKAAEMPKSSLRHAMTGKRNIPIQYWYKLNNILTDYGYKSSDVIDADPPFDLFLPFDQLDITVLSGNHIHINSNYTQIADVLEFLNIISICLERRLDDEIEEYGKEFVVKSRLLGFDETL